MGSPSPWQGLRERFLSQRSSDQSSVTSSKGKFLINWAACDEPSLRNGFHFFSRGYFWEVVVGLLRPPDLIFTLFPNNIFKVNVREFLPRDKTDKGNVLGS